MRSATTKVLLTPNPLLMRHRHPQEGTLSTTNYVVNLHNKKVPFAQEKAYLWI